MFDQILVDVAAHSLGIKTLDKVRDGFGDTGEADCFAPIIHRNTPIPATRSQLFKTVVDGQDYVQVEVYQGESRLCSGNTLIGVFPFELAPAPAGSPVLAEFSYDSTASSGWW